jgi:hypothetical protein
MRIITRAICLTFGAALSLVASGACMAADAAQQPVEEIQELDEIWVRGQYLSRVIEDAEDDFFKRYNELNKDTNYDVFCGQMSLRSGSMIMVRNCIPGFIVYSAYDPMTNSVRLGGLGQQCNGMYAWRDDTNGSLYYENRCVGTSTRSYVGPDPGLLAAARRPAYAANVFRVVGGDPRLLEMARNLGTLYDEMELTQHHYVKVKAESKPVRPTRTARPVVGPRTM